MRAKSPERILKHIDSKIELWLDIYNDPEDAAHPAAVYYIDAYQEMRLAIFGQMKSLKTGGV